MSEETVRLVERIRERLRAATRRMTRAELAFGAAVAVGSVAAIWLLAALLEATFWLTPGLRTTLTVVACAGIVGVGAAYVGRPLARLLGVVDGPSEEDVARSVGKKHPVVADRLVNLLQLAEGQRTHAPAPYVDRAVQHLGHEIDEVQFDEVADFEPARTAARWATVPLLAGLAFLLMAPSTFLGASERLLAPQTEFDRPAPFQLSVTPGDIRLVEGDSLSIEVRARGSAPGNATLLLRRGGEEAPERIALEATDTGTFRHTVPNVRQSLRYRIVASPVRTNWYAVEVVDRPFVRHLQLRVTPPSYTGLPSRQLAPNVGNVTALPGSRVSVTAVFGGPSLSGASLEFTGNDSEPLTLKGDSATGAFVLQQEGSYTVRVRSEGGLVNRDPIQYETSLQADARPSVRFLAPEETSTLSPDLTQQLRVQMSDDYGFRRAALFYRLVADQFAGADSSFQSVALPLSAPESTDEIFSHRWLLAQDTNLQLERGDEVAYFVKVWDNDTVNGPKSGRTATQRLRFPSLSEQYEQLEKQKQETTDQMQDLERESQSVRQQFERLRKELRRTREADWEDRRQLERLRKNQESVEQGVEDVSRQMEEMNRQMQRNDLSSSETTEKVRQLREAIEEVKTPELQEALEQMRKAMQSQNFPRMQRSMENTQSQLDRQRQRLERALKLFEQIKTRQKLEEMSRRAQNLNEREQSIAEKTAQRAEQQPKTDSTRTSETSSPSREPVADSSMTASRPRPDSASARRSESSPSSRSDSARAQKPVSRDSVANEDLAREQEQTAEEMKKLLKTMKEAEQEMNDVSSAPKQKMRQLNKKMQRQNLPQKMQKNSQQLRRNQLQNAQQGQQQIQKRLQSMQSQLSQMQQQMDGSQRQLNMAGLRSALDQILALSHDQESLRKTVERLQDGPTVRRYAPDQKALSDGLQRVADSLQTIAGRLPRMSQAVQVKTGNALSAMGKATSSLDERAANEATGFQKTSMRHLNELAILLSDLLNQMQQQSGGSGSMSMQQMMQQLQQASGQQQKLNKQIQEFLNQIQGERLSKDMEQRRKQLAEQQRRIQKQLEEMDVGSDAQDRIMGDLEKIAEQMNRSAEDLQRGENREDLIDRQQQILTRLLNAQQSLRTQGKKQERQGRTAEQSPDRQPPGQTPPTDDAETLRRDLIRALEMGYNPDYEALIKRYFEILQQRESDAQP